MSATKKCPFCGTDVVVSPFGHVWCDQCDYRLETEKFNARPVEDALLVEIGKLLNESERVKELLQSNKEANHSLAMQLLENSELRQVGAKTVDEIERLRAIAQHQEDLLNAILQPGEYWLELRRGLRGAGEYAVEWFGEYGDSFGLAEQRVVEAIQAALKEMVKR